MGFGKFMAKVGGPGSCARWAIKSYRKIRTQYPTTAEMSEPDVLKLIVASRYAVFPSPKAQDRIDKDFQAGGLNTLEGLVISILQAEHGWDDVSLSQDYTTVIYDVVHDEMVKAKIYPYR